MGRIDAGRLGGMILIAGAISLVSGCAGPVSTPASPTESPIDGVMVTVTVHDVVDLEGGAVAGVLYTGAEMLEANAIGVFGAQVDSDPSGWAGRTCDSRSTRAPPSPSGRRLR